MDNRLQEINDQYWNWQKELSVRLLSLRPYIRIAKDTDKLDFMLDIIGIQEKKLHK